MSVTVRRTEEAILLSLPLDTDMSDIQNILNYFEFIDLVKESKATQADIEALAKEVKQGWWDRNKSRLDGIEDFEK